MYTSWRAALLTLALLAGFAFPAFAAPNDHTEKVLQLDVVAVADGSAISVEGYTTVGVEVALAGTATITFEGSISGTNWTAFPCVSAGTTPAVSATTEASGLWQCQVAGLRALRARISSWTSGTVNVFARATTGRGFGNIGRYDANGNLIIGAGDCRAGESFCFDTAPDAYTMTKGSTVVNKQIMTDVTTNTTSALVNNVSGYKSVWGQCVASSGVCAVTITVYGDNDTTAGPNVMPLCTLTLSDSATVTGGTGDVDWCAPFVATPMKLYAVTTGISGTAATVNVGFGH